MPRDPSLATVRPCSVIAVGVGANLIAGNASALAELTLKGFLLSLQVLLIEEEVLVLLLRQLLSSISRPRILSSEFRVDAIESGPKVIPDFSSLPVVSAVCELTIVELSR